MGSRLSDSHFGDYHPLVGKAVIYRGSPGIVFGSNSYGTRGRTQLALLMCDGDSDNPTSFSKVTNVDPEEAFLHPLDPGSVQARRIMHKMIEGLATIAERGRVVPV